MTTAWNDPRVAPSRRSHPVLEWTNMSMKTFPRAELIERRARDGSHMRRAVVATLGIILAVTGVNYSGMAAGAPAIVTAPNGTPQSTAVNTIFPVRLVAWVRDAS